MKGRFLLVIWILFLILGLVFQVEAEIIKMPGNEFKETLTEEEYLEAVKFVLDVDQKGKVGGFWLTDRKNNILSLAATYLKTELDNQRISKDWKYKLIHLREEKYFASDFVIYRNNIPVIILNITQKGTILLKPDQKKLISSIILPIEETNYYLLVNIYED